MSDPLTLARDLGARSDDELGRLLSARPVASREVRDLFDLGDALLDPTSIRAALRRLDRDTITALAEGAASPPVDSAATAASVSPAAAPALLQLALVSPDGLPYGAVAETARAILTEADDRGAPDAAAPAAGSPHATTPDAAAPDAGPVDAAAGERAFAAITAVAELVQQLRLAPVRILARGGVPSVESKRLSTLLGLDAELVPPIVEVARAAGLVAVEADQLLSTELADPWNARPSHERWSSLVTGWVASLESPLRALYAEALAGGPWPTGAPLAAALERRYPAADETLRTELSHVDGLAHLLGASPAGLGSPGISFPEEVDRVYLQHDLSVIAPGPLRPSLDARLRVVADIENRGLASSYRLTAQTIDRAFATGETAATLREFLAGISLTGIPQALDYLIGEGERRHGLVRVRAKAPEAGSGAEPAPMSSHAPPAARAWVHSPDQRVLGSIAVDQALSSLSLRHERDGSLSSRADPTAVFWLLSDARYPVLAEDADGREIVMRRARILPARRTSTAPATATADGPASDAAAAPAADPAAGTASEAAPALTHDVRQLVLRLRSAAGGGLPPQDDDAAWIARQLDRAVRSRSRVQITLRLADGSETELDVTPQSLANGRLRCLDVRAGVERTVPTANITQVREP
jgi:hypothetical protein